MKSNGLVLSCFLLGCAAMASAQVVSLTADDAAGQSSFTAAGNWSDSLAPHVGISYLVDGKTLRTPATVSQITLFAGDSLTLTNNASLLLMKASTESQQVVCSNLVMQNASIRTMDAAVYLGGVITLQGTSNAPSRFCGDNGQSLYQVAELRGDGVALVNRIEGGGSSYTLRMRGTNANFMGRFVVDGVNVGAGLRLGLGNASNLGGSRSSPEPIVTLKNYGNLFSDATSFQFTNSTWWIEVQNSGALSGSGSGPQTLTISSLIRGTGTLLTYDSGIVYLNGPIEGLTAITNSGVGTLRLGAGFAFAGPVAANRVMLSQPAVVSNTLSVATGALDFTIPSTGEAPTLTALQGFSIGAGKTLAITVDANAYTLDKNQKIALLKAANLATRYPLNAITYSVTDSHFGVMRYQLVYETESGMDVLKLESLVPKPIYLTGIDGSDVASSSFTMGANWSNKLPPGPGTNYIVSASNRLLRCRAAATFAGDSLTVVNFGDFAVNASPAQVNNLRLGPSGILSTRAQGEQILRGTNDVFSTTNRPFEFQIEDNAGIHREQRALKVESVFKGAGDIVFRCYASSTTGGRYTLAAMSPDFTGGVAVQQDGVYLCFSNQLCLGGASTNFRVDRFAIRSSAVVRFLGDVTLDEPTRGITITGTGYLQVTNNNQTVVIKNPITGGTLVKGGRLGATAIVDPGTLVLDATNTYTRTVLQAGTIEVRNPNALGSGPLEFATNCTLRIATASGVKLQSATPLVRQGSATLSVMPYGAPEGSSPWPAYYESNLFVLTATNNIDTTLLTLPIPPSHVVSFRTRSVAEGTQVYVVARLSGTVLLVR